MAIPSNTHTLPVCSAWACNAFWLVNSLLGIPALLACQHTPPRGWGDSEAVSDVDCALMCGRLQTDVAASCDHSFRACVGSCLAARFARHRSRLLASTSRLAANSPCKIAFGNSNARLTPERVRTSTSSY